MVRGTRSAMFLVSDAGDAATDVMIRANEFDVSVRADFYERVIEELKQHQCDAECMADEEVSDGD